MASVPLPLLPAVLVTCDIPGLADMSLLSLSLSSSASALLVFVSQISFLLLEHQSLDLGPKCAYPLLGIWKVGLQNITSNNSSYKAGGLKPWPTNVDLISCS